MSDRCLPAFDSTSVVWQDKIKKVNSRILTSLNKAQELNPTHTGSMDNGLCDLIAGFGDGSINYNYNRFG